MILTALAVSDAALVEEGEHTPSMGRMALHLVPPRGSVGVHPPVGLLEAAKGVSIEEVWCSDCWGNT